MNILKELAQLTPGFYLLLATFAAVAAWEGMRPALVPRTSTPLRWLNNFLWLIINSFFLRAALPLLGIAWAAEVTAKGWGLLPWLGSPVAVNVAAGLIGMDLAGYGVHVLMHKVPLLWRVHAIHHSDIDFDCTTGFRFHPLEALLTTAIRLGVIAAIGLDPVTVLIYETWVGLQNLYGHANARLPAPLEGIFNRLVVTPDMHRIHHSARLERRHEQLRHRLSLVGPPVRQLSRATRGRTRGHGNRPEVAAQRDRLERPQAADRAVLGGIHPGTRPCGARGSAIG